MATSENWPVGPGDILPADGVAGEETRVEPIGHGVLDVAKHLDCPVFIVADAQEPFGAAQTGGVPMGVEIGNVGDVVAMLLQPEGKGKFPEEPFA